MSQATLYGSDEAYQANCKLATATHGLLDAILRNAERHPDTELDALRDALRTCWGTLKPTQQVKVWYELSE